MKRIAARLAGAEPVLLLLIAPALLFPRGFLPLIGLLAILAIWVARLVARGGGPRATPLDLPMLILLMMALASLYPSVDLAQSAPKFYGIVLGVAAYYAVVNGARSRRRWWIGVVAMLAAAGGVALLGLVGTVWSVKLSGTAALYSRLPRLITSVQSSLGQTSGIHPNELGGTLAFLLPLPFALILWSLGRETPTASERQDGTRGIPRIFGSSWFALAAAAVALLLAGPVLVLSQSRSSLGGAAAACALALGLRWRRVGFALMAVAVVGTATAAYVGPQRVADWIVYRDQNYGGARTTLIDRREIWDRAFYMIQDFPFTGIGLNTFPTVLDTLYPAFLAGPDARIPHAHNIYLQTAVDLGLVGLMTFMGIWMIVGWQVVKAYRRAEGLMRGAIVGLGAGCLAYLVYGFTDAITLGAKPLVLLWAMVGLIVAANRLLRDGERGRGGEGESVRLELSPQPSVRGPRSSVLGWSSLAKEAGRTLWGLYWVLALLFVAMAYLVVIITATGWVP